MTEGVVKYHLDYHPAAAVAPAALGELPAWHRLCHRLGLVGRDPARYDGFAYGNLSLRLDADRFLVSGTQTGGLPVLSPAEYALVEACDIAANRVCARGPVQPSSEALSHAAVYQASPATGAVFHAHSPEIWGAAERLGLAVTAPTAAYGTPAMAAEVARLLEDGAVRAAGLFVMGGHQDGVVAFGSDCGGAGAALVRALARALTPA